MKTNKTVRILSLLLVLVLICSAFVGCTQPTTNDGEPENTPTTNETQEDTPSSTDTSDGEQEEVSQKGYLTLVLEGDPAVEYRVNLDKVEGEDGLLSVLEYLNAEKGLAYNADAGFLTEVGEVKQDADAGVYVYIWTSVDADKDVSAYATTKDYNDMTLTSSGVGATDMTVCDGAVIYIGTISWS